MMADETKQLTMHGLSRTANIVACVVAGVMTFVCPQASGAGDIAPGKTKLREDYYRLIDSDPAAARACRDQYMALVNQAPSSRPLFSYIIGAQWPGTLDEEKFRSHKGKFPQLNACQVMVNAGSDILKIEPSKKALKAQGADYTGSGSLEEVIRHPLYKKMLGMPCRVFLFWAHGGEGRYLHAKPMSAEQKAALHREFFEFTKHLLTEYNNSGKTFLIGNWEGDWLAGGEKAGENGDLKPERIRCFREWLDVRTKAIDAAKAAVPHKNVSVHSYLEVNLVEGARTKGVKRLVNSVLPYSHVDYVSISSYEFQGFHQWPEPKSEGNLRQIVFDNLNYVENQLPPRDVSGKRVFIGEIGYTLEEIAKKQKITIEQAKTEQARLALIQARVNIEWGTPLWLWWATYSSHEGTFGLVDNSTGAKSLLLGQLGIYYQWAGDFTRRYQQQTGFPPSSEGFRRQAMEQLSRQISQL